MEVYRVKDQGWSFSPLHPLVNSTDTDFIILPDATSSETAEGEVGRGSAGWSGPGLPQPQWRVPEQFRRQNEAMDDHTDGSKSLPKEFSPSALINLFFIEVSLHSELFKTAQWNL